jgi:hypothetical protein
MKKLCQFGLMKNSMSRLVVFLFCLSGISGASAALVNFQSTVSGLVYMNLAGVQTIAGTMATTLKYNLGDVRSNSVSQSPGSDGFPDKMKVQCVAGLQNNGQDCRTSGILAAYEAWSVIPGSPFVANPAGSEGIADYTPYSLYQDEYSIHVVLDLLTSGKHIFDSPINTITVINNIEKEDSTGYYDAVIISTGLGDFSFRNEFWTLTGPQPEVAPLTNIYLKDALLALPGFPSELTSPSQFSLSFNNNSYSAVFDNVSLPMAVVPEPNVLALLALGLVGLSLVRRSTAV